MAQNILAFFIFEKKFCRVGTPNAEHASNTITVNNGPKIFLDCSWVSKFQHLKINPYPKMTELEKFRSFQEYPCFIHVDDNTM